MELSKQVFGKKTGKEESVPKQWIKGAVAQLIVKKGADPSTAKGIKIFMVDDNGRTKYNDSSLLLFNTQLNLLKAGQREVPLFIGEPPVKKDESE